MAEVRTQQRCWRVGGLDCPDCVHRVERCALAVPGVRQVKADLISGSLQAEIDPEVFAEEHLVDATRQAGHPLSPLDETVEGARLDRRLAVAAVALLVGIVLQLCSYPAREAYAVAVAIGCWRLAGPAWAAVRRRAFTIDSLMLVALVAAAAIGDWFDAALLAVLFGVAEEVEAASHRRTARAVGSLLALAPSRARVERAGQVVEVAAAEVAVGERLRLRPGDVIPLDGVVLEGSSGVDQAALTGESVPVAKGPGDEVSGGTLAVDGALTVQVTRPAGDSAVARIVAQVERARSTASPTQRVVDRFAAWYTPLVITLALAVWILGPLVFGLELRDALLRGTALLVIGCPCAIVLATPIAIASGLTAAARRGILVRGGEVLERAGRIRAVAFDKTGTLTLGQPELKRLVPLAELDEGRLLWLAAALEADSAHPLARALVAAAAARGLAPPPAAGHQAVPGQGVVGQVDGRRYLLGGRRLLAAEGVPLDEAERVAAQLEGEGLSVALLASDRPLAAFGLADTVRPEAAEALADLSRLADSVMLTGDRAPAAAAIAQQLGLAGVEADLLPGDKLAIIRRLNERAPTAMVGDGINDAPALAAAEVGLVLGTLSSGIAQETADISLLAADLRGVPRALRLARAVRRTIAVNIGLALAVRLALVPLALTGNAALWLAVLGDVGGTLAVSANSLRLLRSR